MASLAFEIRLNDWLLARRMSVQSFADLVKAHGIQGAGRARLSEALREGGTALPNTVVERLEPLRLEIEGLCKAASPLALDLSDAFQVHQWLKDARNGDLKILIVNSRTADAFTVSFAGGYFAGGTKPQETPMIVTKDVADGIADRLRDLGYDGVSIRRADSDANVVSDFEQAWQ